MEWSLSAVQDVVAADGAALVLVGRDNYVTGALINVDGGTDF